MRIISANIKWIMLASGLLTCTMLYAAVSPEAALLSTFGETLEGPVANLVTRSWGVLIALMGVMLIYGAFTPPVRTLVLTIAGTSKLLFVLLVLSEGARFLGYQAGIASAADAIWVVLFALYLLFPAHRDTDQPKR